MKYLLSILLLSGLLSASAQTPEKVGGICFDNADPTGFVPDTLYDCELWYNTVSESFFRWSRDGSNWVAFPGSGSALPDGNYGAFTISGGGSVATLNDEVVTYAKIQDVTSGKLLGRYSATGPPQEITLGSGLSFTDSTLSAQATGVVQYDTGTGAVIWSTDTTTSGPVTFAINVSTGEFTFNIPAGVDIIRANVAFANTDADGDGAVYLIFDYTGARAFNTEVENAKVPLVRLFNGNDASMSRTTPLNMTNGGSNTNDKSYGLSDIAGGDGSDLEMKITNAPVALSNILLIDFSN